MKDVRNLVGLPVICGGKRIGRAASVELSRDLTQMSGLIVECGLKGSRYVAADEGLILGEVSIIATKLGGRVSPQMPLRRRALSTDGALRGAIVGALIDDDTRKVEALLLSLGYVDDIVDGRRWIRQYAVSKESGDVLFAVSSGRGKEVKQDEQDEEESDEKRDEGRTDGRGRAVGVWGDAADAQDEAGAGSQSGG